MKRSESNYWCAMGAALQSFITVVVMLLQPPYTSWIVQQAFVGLFFLAWAHWLKPLESGQKETE